MCIRARPRRISGVPVRPAFRKLYASYPESKWRASILKFIEANWGLRTLSPRSRDNLPNPVASPESPYIPSNGPALGDLMSIFDFTHKQPAPPLIIPGAI